MRDPIEQLRRRLIELGCPLSRATRMVREVAEHREDSLRDLIADGMTAAEAEMRANVRLGDPRTLAENLMESLRQSSWCGRHRFIAFGLVPKASAPQISTRGVELTPWAVFTTIGNRQARNTAQTVVTVPIPNQRMNSGISADFGSEYVPPTIGAA